MRRIAFRFVLTFVGLGAAWGCQDKQPASTEDNAAASPQPSATATNAAKPSNAATKAPAASVQAKRIFETRCVVCHGSKGEGDGPGAAAIEPKPRKFSDATWLSAVTDEHLSQVIIGGGAAVKLSPAMPPNPDLKDKPEVVAALVQVVRSFGGENAAAE